MIPRTETRECTMWHPDRQQPQHRKITVLFPMQNNKHGISFITKLPPPSPIKRTPPSSLHLFPLLLSRPLPIIFLFLRSRHLRPPEARRTSPPLKDLSVLPEPIRKFLCFSLSDQIFAFGVREGRDAAVVCGTEVVSEEPVCVFFVVRVEGGGGV